VVSIGMTGVQKKCPKDFTNSIWIRDVTRGKDLRMKGEYCVEQNR
jgi:hypothetical protein